MTNKNNLSKIGIDISEASIEASQIKKTLKGFEVHSLSRVKLVPGIVVNGIIKNTQALEQELKNVFEKAKPNSFEGKSIIIGSPEAHTYIYHWSYPKGLPEKKMLNALLTELSSVLPVSPEKLSFSWKKLDSACSENEVLFVGCRKSVLDKYTKLISAAGLKSNIYDLESASSMRGLVKKYPAKKGFLLLDIGAYTTKLNIFDSCGLRFSKISKLAGNHFDAVLSDALKISKSEGEEIKKKFGLDPKKKSGKVFQLLQQPMQELIKEIKRAASFYNEKTGNSIAGIYLIGGNSLMPKIIPYFKMNTKIPSKAGIPFVFDSLKKKPPQSVMFAQSIGLSLRSFSSFEKEAQVNLCLNKIEEKQNASILHKIKSIFKR